MSIQRPIPQLLLAAFLLLLSACANTVQSRTSTNAEAELDQMLAPIALYPDSVLTHVLIASTYPLEIVQAARWLEQNPNLAGEDAVDAAQSQDWDPSVQALVAFPQLIQRLNDDLDWTQQLGETFLANEPELMASIQRLRQRAYAQGTLNKMEHVVVEREREVIVIEPARREVIYVPYYDTRVVYGNWWWPAYPPVYWYEPRTYRNQVSFYWSSGFRIRPSFYFSVFDWHRHHVIVHHHYYHKPPRYYPRRHHFNDAPRWSHDQYHRRGVHYRHSYLRDKPDYQHRPDRPRRGEDRYQQRDREQWRNERQHAQRPQSDRFIPRDSNLRQSNSQQNTGRDAERQRQYAERNGERQRPQRFDQANRSEPSPRGRIAEQWAENEQRIQPIQPAENVQRPQRETERVRYQREQPEQRLQPINRPQQDTQRVQYQRQPAEQRVQPVTRPQQETQRVQYQRQPAEQRLQPVTRPQQDTQRVQYQRQPAEQRVQPVSRPQQEPQRIQYQRPQAEPRSQAVSRPAPEQRPVQAQRSVSERSARFESQREQIQ